MTTEIRLTFDTMHGDVAQKMAAAIEFYVDHNFPQAGLRSSEVSQRKTPTLVVAGPPQPAFAEVVTNFPPMNDDGELRPGHVVLGMGVTQSVGSDRYPGTITRFSASQKTVWFTNDEYKRTDDNGYGGVQEYEFKMRPTIYDHDGTATNEHMARWNAKRKCYVISGTRSALSKGRRAYQDPSF